MTTRDKQLLAIRPKIEAAKITDTMSQEERFQNVTLRPIIKLQNDILTEAFTGYIKKYKNVFYQFTTEKRLDYINNALHKDTKFKNTIIGMINGLFTNEEYALYSQHTSVLNKRLTTMVIQRLQSNIQLFENPKVLN